MGAPDPHCPRPVSRVLVEAGLDAGALWHTGDPYGEQRRLLAGQAIVLPRRDVVAVSGPDMRSWLHAITSQDFLGAPEGESFDALILDAQGHLRFALTGIIDGTTFTACTEAGHGPALADFLRSMVFAMRVDVTTPEATVVCDVAEGRLETRIVAPGNALDAAIAGRLEAGMWALEAVRIAAGIPRWGLDTDDRTIPNEIGLWGTALDKGCYPGQETVGRVHTLGRPPRRLVRLLLDGSEDALPDVGSDVLLGDKVVGRVGSSSRHCDDGPIALALVRRNTPVDAELLADGIPAAQEALVDPDVGLHVRPLA